MGDRLVGMLIGVVLGVIPGAAILLIAAAVTDNFADQAGMGVGLLAILLICLGGIGGLVAGALTGPQVRGQSLAGLALGALPAVGFWALFGELNLMLLAVCALLLGALGLHADLRHRADADNQKSAPTRTPEKVA